MVGLLLVLPALLLASPSSAPWPCPRPIIGRADVVACIGLSGTALAPLGGDSLEVRIWREGALTGLSLTRALRVHGVWAVTTYFGSRRASALTVNEDATPQSWADRWPAALAAGLDTLPPEPAIVPSLPRSDGESVTVEWTAGASVREVRSNRPLRCTNPSDRTLAAALDTLGLSLC